MARIILTIFPLTVDVIYEKVCGFVEHKRIQSANRYYI